MKRFIFTETLGPLIEQYHPKIIVETGTHSGRSATFMCMQALKHQSQVQFHGFDLFDLASDRTHSQEINGKGTGNYDKALARLSGIATVYPGFSFQLHKGFTTDTLTSPISADLAYIDGGHSTPTVLHDYAMLKDSGVIVFDDYQLASVRDAIDAMGLTNHVKEFAFGKTKQAIFINQ